MNRRLRNPQLDQGINKEQVVFDEQDGLSLVLSLGGWGWDGNSLQSIGLTLVLCSGIGVGWGTS